jgi:hypothetical protein
MAKGLFGRAFLKRILLESAGLPPSSIARLFDRHILNHNILWSVKKKNQYMGHLGTFFLGIATQPVRREKSLT